MSSRYTCHSDNNGTAPRLGTHTMPTIHGKVEIHTEWKPISCGHITSHLDDDCVGCVHQKKEAYA